MKEPGLGKVGGPDPRHPPGAGSHTWAALLPSMAVRPASASQVMSSPGVQSGRPGRTLSACRVLSRGRIISQGLAQAQQAQGWMLAAGHGALSTLALSPPVLPREGWQPPSWAPRAPAVAPLPDGSDPFPESAHSVNSPGGLETSPV